MLDVSSQSLSFYGSSNILTVVYGISRKSQILIYMVNDSKHNILDWASQFLLIIHTLSDETTHMHAMELPYAMSHIRTRWYELPHHSQFLHESKDHGGEYNL